MQNFIRDMHAVVYEWACSVLYAIHDAFKAKLTVNVGMQYE